MTKIKNIHYIHFDTIDSTVTWTKKNAPTLDPNQLTCVTALEQTSGKGRFQRKWISPKGQNIYASLYFTLPKHSSYISNLGQILSLSCITVLKKMGFHPQIKWPNDILLNQKKVAGILCDTHPLEEKIAIILSIGINVNMTADMLTMIDQPATSLAQLSGQTWSLEQIIDPILHQLIEDLELLQSQGFSAFQSTYEELLAFKGEMINFNDGIRTYRGICHSVRPDGRLNLLMPNGEFVTVSAGEIKVS